MSLTTVDRKTFLRRLRRIRRAVANPGKRAGLLKSARAEIPLVREVLKVIERTTGKPSSVARQVNLNARRDLLMLLALWEIEHERVHSKTAAA